jgi:hypothetical protein
MMDQMGLSDLDSNLSFDQTCFVFSEIRRGFYI